MRGRVAYLILAAALAGLSAHVAKAADLESVSAARTDGVECEGPEAKAFDSVWLGHFTGGYSHKLGPGLPVALDWRDETLCFPSRRACDRHMSVMRREFHRPEGDFTCLPIR